jgi:hypothetical protein
MGRAQKQRFVLWGLPLPWHLRPKPRRLTLLGKAQHTPSTARKKTESRIKPQGKQLPSDNIEVLAAWAGCRRRPKVRLGCAPFGGGKKNATLITQYTRLDVQTSAQGLAIPIACDNLSHINFL